MSPLHIIDSIRRSEKGDYLLSRTDGEEFCDRLGWSDYVCQFTRPGMSARDLVLSFDHLDITRVTLAPTTSSEQLVSFHAPGAVCSAGLLF